MPDRTAYYQTYWQKPENRKRNAENARRWRAQNLGATPSPLPYRPREGNGNDKDLDAIALRDPLVAKGRPTHA